MPRKNSRAANGTGTIRQRPDGRWECRVTVGKNPATGKPLRKSFYAPTQNELVKLMKQVQSDLDNGTFIEPSKLTVGAWMDIWIAEYLGGVKESTQASYRGHTKNHIKPNLGAVLLQKLTPHAVQKFYNGLTKAGKSAKTVKNIHGILHQSLEEAVKQDYIRKNPAANPTLPRVVKPDIKVMDNDDVSAFLMAIEGHRFEAIYFVDLFSGMRQAEVCAMTWQDIDLDEQYLTVRRSICYDSIKKKLIIGPTKRKRIRTVDFCDTLAEILKDEKKRQLQSRREYGEFYHDNYYVSVKENSRTYHEVYTLPITASVPEAYNKISFVCIRQDGSREAPHTVTCICKAMRNRIEGFENFHFHMLRHTYTSKLLAHGAAPKDVQELLGHLDINTTLNVYAHATRESKRSSAMLLDGKGSVT